MIDITRRQGCKLLATSTLGLLSGCVCCTSGPIRVRKDIKITGFLAPEGLYEINQSKVKCFDVHGHFFNATDMQAGGYVSGPVANEFDPNSTFGIFWKLVGKAIDIVARIKAPCAEKEYKKLFALQDELSKLSKEDKPATIKDGREKDEEKIGTAIEDYARKHPEFREAYENLLNEVGITTSDYPINQALILQSIGRGEQQLENKINALTSTQQARMTVTLSIFEFMTYMLSYRFHNIDRYFKAYRNDKKPLHIVGAAGALVDFNRWVDGCEEAYSPIGDQILLYDLIAKTQDYRIFNLVSYNPWTATLEKEGQTYTDLIKSALGLKTFKGIKLYPTVGFFPLGNSDASRPSRPSHHPDPGKLDDALKDMYDYCEKNQKPVMTHGMCSLATKPEYLKTVAPIEWHRVLRDFPDLKLNVGHFGYNSKNRCKLWTKQLIKYMRFHKGLYADLGYWEGLENKAEALKLWNLLQTDIGNGEQAIDRVMFGTDWLMTAKEGNWREYPSMAYDQLLAVSRSPEALHKLFYANALKFYNMDY
ncbi:amidohydrolase family protein [Porticoccus sp. GXU_MW_L64]